MKQDKIKDKLNIDPFREVVIATKSTPDHYASITIHVRLKDPQYKMYLQYSVRSLEVP